MAQNGNDREEDLKIVENLRIKIAECRDLPSRIGGSRIKEVYCSVRLDQTELYRSGTALKSDPTIFGDEFSCTVPCDFRYVSFYLCESRSGRIPKPIAKVTFQKQDISEFNGQDRWFPLQAAGGSKSADVMGKIHVELMYEECINANDSRVTQRIGVKIIDYCDLGVVMGRSTGDLYALATLSCNLDGGSTKKIKIRRHSSDVVYFEFDNYHVHDTSSNQYNLGESPAAALGICKPYLKITVWHDIISSFSSYFHGELRIPVEFMAPTNRAWYCLKPRDAASAGGVGRTGASMKENSDGSVTSTASSIPSSLGQLRLKIGHQIDQVLPSDCYAPLKSLLINSVNVQPIHCSAAYLLSLYWDEAARPITRLMLQAGQLSNFIHHLAEDEMTRVEDVNSLFRNDSFVTRCVEQLLKLVGSEYLRSTLKPVLDQIFEEKKCCEVDPLKLREPSHLELNKLNLIVYCEKIFFAIVNSAKNCPQAVTDAFIVLRELAVKHYPAKPSVPFIVLNNLIVLRFFAVAIMNPKMFEVRKDNPEPNVSRTLTLISKTILRLTNLAVYGKLSNKEPYMAEILENFSDDRHRFATRKWLDLISSNDKAKANSMKAALVLKEGTLGKWGSPPKYRPWEREKFKWRYFTLTDQELLCSKVKGKTAQSRIPITEILGVERVPEHMYQTKFVFHVAQAHRVWTLKANSSLEESEWVTMLRKICAKKRSDYYHPGSFMDGHWSCCRSLCEQASGCIAKASREPSLSTAFALSEMEFELERCHVAFKKNLKKLLTICELCTTSSSVGSANNESVRLSASWEIRWDEAQCLLCTLKQVVHCTNVLESEHKVHLRKRLRQLRYGSIDAPIGDDNYLILRSRVADLDELPATSSRAIVIDDNYSSTAANKL